MYGEFSQLLTALPRKHATHGDDQVGVFRGKFRNQISKLIADTVTLACTQLGIKPDVTDLPLWQIYHDSLTELAEAETMRATAISKGNTEPPNEIDEIKGLRRLVSRARWESDITAIFGAHTASRAAYRVGEYAAMLGVPVVKTWKTVLDGRERPAHYYAHGQTVPINTPFEVGGELADYPGDPALSAGNRFNCRCTIIVGLGISPLTGAIVGAAAAGIDAITGLVGGSNANGQESARESELAPPDEATPWWLTGIVPWLSPMDAPKFTNPEAVNITLERHGGSDASLEMWPEETTKKTHFVGWTDQQIIENTNETVAHPDEEPEQRGTTLIFRKWIDPYTVVVQVRIDLNPPEIWKSYPKRVD